jgi:YHS domain-containing protein
MKIEPEYAAEIEYYKEKIFYFCAQSCKKEFNSNPRKYFNAVNEKDNDNAQSNEKEF